jgi:TRAP-type C4-dicarboxylate transport system permease small subunit
MKTFLATFKRITGWMNALAGVAVVFMMLLTAVDVVMRTFGTALVGAYELVSVAAAVVAGFALPKTSWDGGHVSVDFLLVGRSPRVRNSMLVCTKMMGIALCAALSLYFYKKGIYLFRTGEVSLTLHLPLYPFSFGLSVCMFMECWILITDICRAFLMGDDR